VSDTGIAGKFGKGKVMLRIELIYDNDCPNVESTREQLREVIKELNINLTWQEWDRESSTTPNYARQYGSPTILVNGCDVAGDGTEGAANCCRVYADCTGAMSGVPPVSRIKETILRAGGDIEQKDKMERNFRWKGTLTTFPAIGAVLIPGISCPACWPAYAGFLSSLGLGFVNYTPYLIPLVSVLLFLTLFSLWHRAGNRRGYGPLYLGLAAAACLIIGRFAVDSLSLMYGGIGFLVLATAWNSLPKKKTSSCSACTGN